MTPMTEVVRVVTATPVHGCPWKHCCARISRRSPGALPSMGTSRRSPGATPAMGRPATAWVKSSSDPKASELADRPSSMAASAFLGIAWFICIELNIRLLYRATRGSLYFWSCLLCSWGLVVHGISIVLANFTESTKIWRS